VRLISGFSPSVASSARRSALRLVDFPRGVPPIPKTFKRPPLEIISASLKMLLE
jgi:hypothetical protein